VRVLCVADVRGNDEILLDPYSSFPFSMEEVFSESLLLIRTFKFVQGNLKSLNDLAKQARADHIIHTGDFGFYDETSLERIADK
jgi:hypothetical protein